MHTRADAAIDIPIDLEEIAGLAADLVRIPTVYGNGEAEAVACIATLLRREGVPHRVQEVRPGRPNLVVELGDDRGPRLWFNGHLDTVPIGNRLTWMHEPFGGDVHDGHLYGRGASDCKGGVAAMIYAAIGLHRARVPLHGSLCLSAVMGDEEGWIGIRHLLDAGMRADAFVSTQWSTAGQIAVAYRGLCWMEVTTSGRIAHGSRPGDGINAVEQMVDTVLPALRALRLPSMSSTSVTIPGPEVNLSTISGGYAANIVPDVCRATLDYRLAAGQSSDAVVQAVDLALEALRESRPSLTVERKVLLQSEPLFTDPACDLVQRLGHAVATVTGSAAQYFGKTGTSDANLVHERLRIPAVAYGPGNGSGHGPDEHVALSDLEQVTRVYATFAADMLGGRLPS